MRPTARGVLLLTSVTLERQVRLVRRPPERVGGAFITSSVVKVKAAFSSVRAAPSFFERGLEAGAERLEAGGGRGAEAADDGVARVVNQRLAEREHRLQRHLLEQRSAGVLHPGHHHVVGGGGEQRRLRLDPQAQVVVGDAQGEVGLLHGGAVGLHLEERAPTPGATGGAVHLLREVQVEGRGRREAVERGEPRLQRLRRREVLRIRRHLHDAGHRIAEEIVGEGDLLAVRIEEDLASLRGGERPQHHHFAARQPQRLQRLEVRLSFAGSPPASPPPLPSPRASCPGSRRGARADRPLGGGGTRASRTPGRALRILHALVPAADREQVAVTGQQPLRSVEGDRRVAVGVHRGEVRARRSALAVHSEVHREHVVRAERRRAQLIGEPHLRRGAGGEPVPAVERGLDPVLHRGDERALFDRDRPWPSFIARLFGVGMSARVGLNTACVTTAIFGWDVGAGGEEQEQEQRSAQRHLGARFSEGARASYMRVDSRVNWPGSDARSLVSAPCLTRCGSGSPRGLSVA